jgi:hypothetical protein
MRDLKWSPAEKAIARKAFDRALGRELEAVILETKSKARAVRPLGAGTVPHSAPPGDRPQVRLPLLDSPLVLANVLSGGRLNENELHGLGEDKLGYIHRAAVHL